MDPVTQINKIAMYETQGCLVFPIQQELTKESAEIFQKNLLEHIHSRSIIGVVIDLSGIQVIDSALWTVFTKTSQMINVIGFPSVITSLSPGVVASIIDLNLPTDTITTTLNLGEALEILTQSGENHMNDNSKLEADEILENQIEKELDDVFEI